VCVVFAVAFIVDCCIWLLICCSFRGTSSAITTNHHSDGGTTPRTQASNLTVLMEQHEQQRLIHERRAEHHLHLQQSSFVLQHDPQQSVSTVNCEVASEADYVCELPRQNAILVSSAPIKLTSRSPPGMNSYISRHHQNNSSGAVFSNLRASE
jgi:hypothetical protein